MFRASTCAVFFLGLVLAARHLLHLDVHGFGRQAVPRLGDDRHDAAYFFFQTPQFVYYIIPMAVLVATLVTVGLMTKNSELVVMRACGISLYRTAAPLLLFGSGGERGAVRPAGTGHGVLEPRGRSPESPHPRASRRASFGALDRRWMVAQNGDIYHYDLFDPNRKTSSISSPSISSTGARWDLRAVTRANAVALTPLARREGRSTQGVGGHDRLVARLLRDDRRTTSRRPPSAIRRLPGGRCRSSLPAYFKNDEPTPR